MSITTWFKQVFLFLYTMLTLFCSVFLICHQGYVPTTNTAVLGRHVCMKFRNTWSQCLIIWIDNPLFREENAEYSPQAIFEKFFQIK